MTVRLNSVERVRDFVNTVSGFESDVDLVSTRYVIDAKSIMGIFSLDLTRPLIVEIHDKNEEPEILQALEKYAVA